VSRTPRVVVAGAGAFGGWTALGLVRRGASVTLVDARGPGHLHASSGGETRVTRAVYGANHAAARLAIRSMTLWKEQQERFGVVLFRERGVVWMTTTDDDSYLSACLPLLRETGWPFEEITPQEAAARFPALSFDDVRRVVFEPMGGYLLARRACETVWRAVAAEGGRVLQAEVEAPGAGAVRGLHEGGGRLDAVRLKDGTRLEADAFVFACGPWLGTLFPDVIGDRIRPTRQELFTFTTPPGDLRFDDEHLPTWADLGPPLRYGIPGPAHRSEVSGGGEPLRGMKFGDDTRGPEFDPTGGDRRTTPEGERRARLYLEQRLPGLGREAPLESSQVCQYENTPDNLYLIDRHPHVSNLWIAGGGSGHGFKNGPAVGEMLAETILAERPLDRAFRLGRLAGPA
jgi:glycine/D-amino acid oxidase-like deaminating enzyme